MSSRTYPSRPWLAASVAVFREGRVLLASRTKPPSDTLFTLPGGIVEPGETLEAAALRELHEEVGVTAEIVGFNDHVQILESDPDGRVRHHFVVCSFVARWTGGEGTAGDEAGEVVWVHPEELAGMRVTERLPEILARASRILDGRR